MTVTLVVQTTVRPGCEAEFARWQGETSAIVSRFPGFVEQQLMPPNPPLQADWVIQQRFATADDARRWLTSPERLARLEQAASMLIGRDDVHIVDDRRGGPRPAPVSAIVATRVKPGCEDAYRAWERRIAAVQARAPGLQGYRFESPVPGVQDDFVAILRFDSAANLQAWLDSPERRRLLDEATPLVDDLHARVAHTGFEQWFRDGDDAAARAPAWKMDMVVLLVLYPIVFLFGTYVTAPLLLERLQLPGPLALFLGNVVSVALTGALVPAVAARLGWWLVPAAGRRGATVAGAALLCALYAVMIALFCWVG